MVLDGSDFTESITDKIKDFRVQIVHFEIANFK